MEKRKQLELSEQEYLKYERSSEIKYEYTNGQVYAMSGASANHGKIAGNLFANVHTKLKTSNSDCTAFIADMKVKTQSSYFYPDIMVICEPDDNEEYYKTSPIIIFEILSHTTKRFDKNDKKFRYMQLTSLQEYVLVDQYTCEVEVYRKSKDWVPESYYLGQNVTFESIDLTLTVEDIYYQVENTDIQK